MHHDMTPAAYFDYAQRQREKAKASQSLEEDNEVESYFFVSSIPWLHYREMNQPSGRESNPRFSWGKYEADFRGELMLPFTVLVHHALADGIHIARFYACLDEEIARLADGR